VEASGLSLAFLLHSFLSFVSLLICLRSALDIGDLGCVMVVGSGLWVCMGQILVAMSWIFMNYGHDLYCGVVYLVGGS
jgi:hypothetical protein